MLTGEKTRDEGKQCRRCRQTEARCAWAYGECCPACTHWLHYDPAGNELLSVSHGGRRRLPVEHGTDRGYYQHRVRHEEACASCRAAHSRRVVKSKTGVLRSSSLRLVVSQRIPDTIERTVAS